MNFRFGVLTAVSKQDQATEDKDSLDVQLRRSREFGEKWGGTFIREYRADGFSRSGWFDLTPAIQTCSAFTEMIRDANCHAFDVVIVESYDRLGDLGLMFFNYFAGLGRPYIQMISVQQKIMIEDPALYHPREDDSIPNAITDSLKTNKYRTNKVFRAFDIGLEKRAKDGYYTNNFPHGYIKQDRYNVIPDPIVAPQLQQMQRWLMSGDSFYVIANKANALGYVTRTGVPWSIETVSQTLKNVFYAGKIGYKKGQNTKPKTNGKDKGYRRRNTYELYDGKHEPLWTWEEHQRMLAEIERRRRTFGARHDYNLSSLMKCSICGKTLHISYSLVTKEKHYKYWQCYKHVSIRVDVATRLVADAVVKALEQHQDQEFPASSAPTPDTEKQIVALERQRQKIVRIHETTETYTEAEYAEKIKDLNKQLDDLRDQKLQTELAAQRTLEAENIRLTLKNYLPHFEEWMNTAPPKEVSYLLSRLCKITAYPDKHVSIELVG